MIGQDRPRIEPLTPDRWPDFERLFGPNGACAGCWCMWWRLPRKAFDAGSGDRNRAAFRAIVETGPPPGLIAYLEEKPVGWCQVTPRSALPILDRSRLLSPVDDRPVWSLSCFFIKAGYRRHGLSAALIEAAIDHARRSGAMLLEAYPWETSEKKASGTIYTGQASTFRRLGFFEVARRAPHRPIMRFELSG